MIALLKSARASVLLGSAFLLACGGVAVGDTIVPFAGGGAAYGDGGPAFNAGFDSPLGMTVDLTGNVFICDTMHSTIRRVDAISGVITTYAGLNGNPDFSGDGGPATSAAIGYPFTVASDTAGNLFIADILSNRIRRVSAATGVIATIAGNGSFSGGDGGPAIAAGLGGPEGVAVDAAGNVYIADTGNYRIRRVSAATGIITTIAGTGSSGGSGPGDGGPATLAELVDPRRVAVDPSGNLYILDLNAGNARIRRVDAGTHIITRVAGGGASAGESGLAVNANIGVAADISVNAGGTLYVAGQRRVWVVTLSDGAIRVLAGTGASGNSGDTGDAQAATFTDLGGVAISPAGRIYVADSVVGRVRRVRTKIQIDAFAGGGASYGDGGPATSARLEAPQGIVLDPSDNVFIADNVHFTIRRVDAATGVITTVAGMNGDFGDSGDGGPATAATLSGPYGIALDGPGNLYMADSFNGRIRRISAASGVITTVAGNGSYGYSGDGGSASIATLAFPLGVAADAAGNLFIADTDNLLIRRVDAVTGVIARYAGNHGCGPMGGDGIPALNACFNDPRRVVLDASGNLFVLDRNGSTLIRRIDAVTHIITTVAGGGTGSGASGPAVQANLGFAEDLALDRAGHLYIGGALKRVWRVDLATGMIRLFAGTGDFGGTGDGGDASAATFNGIGGLAVSSIGDLLIADDFANRVRRVRSSVLVDAATPQALLDGLTALDGGLRMADVAARPTLLVPALASLEGGLDAFGNAALANLGADVLRDVGGNIVIRDNPLLGSVVLPGLTQLGGGLTVVNNAAATTIDFSSLGGVGGDVTITDNEAAATVDFSALGGVGGDVTITDNDAAATVDFSALGGVGGDVTITDNEAAATVDFSALGGIGGDVTITDNEAAASVDFSALGGVGGDVTITDNLAATSVHLAGLTDVDGGLTISNHPLLGSVALPSLTQVGGGLTVVNNTAATTIDLSSLGSAGGSVIVENNIGASEIDLGTLGSAGGSVIVANNIGASEIDLGSLGSAGGSVIVENNIGASEIDLGTLGSAGGSVIVANNIGAGEIDLGSLGSAGGSVIVENNIGATDIFLDSLTDVGGDLTLETQGQSDVDLSGVEVGGDIDVSADGADSVEVAAPGGTTSVEMCNGAACMDADLPDDAAPAGTPFAVLHIDALAPVPGQDASGEPAVVDPVAAYAFTLGAPLQGAASLVFDLTLASLSAEEQTAVLDAYVNGRLTLTVQSDAPGSVPQARTQCGPADPLVADGCVKVGAFDGLGFQLPPGETTGAASLRIAALVSHFSTYAVAIVTPVVRVAGDANCDGLINGGDVGAFVLAVLDANAYGNAHPACLLMNSDSNVDSAVDASDVEPFVNCLLNGVCP